MLSAAEAVDALRGGADAAATWEALTRGALLGARGNSGVIVSQAVRGMGEVLGRTPGGGAGLRGGLARAAEMARAAVVRPVEGTVLSVLSAAARAVRDAPDDLGEVSRRAADEARRALRRTTQQLDALSRNGVVDGEAALIGADLAATAVEVVRRLISGGSEMVTLVPAVRGHLERTRPDLEIVEYEGGQGGYPLLIGVE